MNSLEDVEIESLKKALRQLCLKFERVLAVGRSEPPASADGFNVTDRCCRCCNDGPWHGLRCLSCGFISDD
jgi:hypothetical protein